MKFNNNNDLKEFVKILIEKLEMVNETVLAKELKEWDEGFFTTSSEFLGEFKILLEKTKSLYVLDNDTMKDIEDCISKINKAFGA